MNFNKLIGLKIIAVKQDESDGKIIIYLDNFHKMTIYDNRIDLKEY